VRAACERPLRTDVAGRREPLCHYGPGETPLRAKPPSRKAGRPALDKRLGQHHLLHGGLCRPLLEYLRPDAGDRVLEIGPGGGVLTAELVATGARVIAVELDPRWAFALAATPSPPAAIAVADALDLDWDRLPASTLVAGNLPYGVGTAIVERFLSGALGRCPRAAFLLQSEVVDRIVAGPGDRAYGALSVLVAARARAFRLGRLGPAAFRPRPKVESSFVGLEPVPTSVETEDFAPFVATVRAAFAQRRKTLRNSLASSWGRARTERILAVAGIPPDLRAERLGLDAFVALHRAATGSGC